MPEPGLGILIADESAAFALGEVLQRAGYQVVVESEDSTSRSRLENPAVVAWISDTRSEQVFDWLYGTGKLLFPANDAPGVEHRQEFYDWSSGLVLQISTALGGALGQMSAPGAATDSSNRKDIWLLVGSAGAPAAVQRFLNYFEVLPPVGFIYAQHFSVLEQQVLAQLSAENPLFTMEVGIGLHALEAGRVIVVPPQCQIRFDDFGNITSTRSPWNAPHTPNFDQLLTFFAETNFSTAGVIVFSGMGQDGVSALNLPHQSGARIWSQTPQSAVCDSMPQAALNTGLIDFQGDPEQLAAALEELYH